MKEFFLSLLLFLTPLEEKGKDLQANLFQDLWHEFVGKVWEEKKDFWLTFQDFNLPSETEKNFRALHGEWERDANVLILSAKSSGKNHDLYGQTLKKSFDLLEKGKENEEKTSIMTELTGVLDTLCDVCNLQAVNRQGAHEQCMRICR